MKPARLAMIPLLFVAFMFSSAHDITGILSKYDEFSIFNRLLSLTNVATEINSLESITVLAPDDTLLQFVVDIDLPVGDMADILRHHVLLKYMGKDHLSDMPSIHITAPTLYEFKATADEGIDNVDPSLEETGVNGTGLPHPNARSGVSIVRILAEIPHSISVLQTNRVILPSKVIAAAAAAAMVPTGVPTPTPAPAPAPLPVNVSAIMISAGQFNTFVSLLEATKVGELYQTQANDTGTGITIFAPTDKAFAALKSGAFNKLTADQKIDILKYHALSAFYPLASLQQFTDPVAPTLATDSNGAGSYTVNITNMEGAVVISTGLVRSPIISTLYNTNPCAIFAVSKVLLPEEIFGLPAPTPAPSPAPISTPGSSPSPSSSLQGSKTTASAPESQLSTSKASLLGTSSALPSAMAVIVGVLHLI